MKIGKNLFTVIFLWFLGGMVLMVFVSIGLTIFMARQGIILTGREEILESVLANQGLRSIEIYESEGQDALRRKLEEIRRESRFGVHIFDTEGNSLAPGPLDDRVREIVRSSRERGETTYHHRNLFVVIQERASETTGKVYELAGVLYKRPLFPDLTRNKPALFIHLLGLSLTVVVVTWFLARHLSKPIGKLNMAAREMARGNLSVRVDEALKKRSDEIGQLGESFDVMARHVSGLLNAEKRLIRDISHELRSPLARLGVALELARQRSGEGAREALERIELESKRLEELIGQLLSVARLEADMGHVPMETADLKVFLKNIADDARFEAAHQRKAVRFKPETGECRISFNAGLLRSAVENVIRNAVRHTPGNSHVDVKIAEDAGNAVISVRDYGPGVPPEELPNLFRPFYRVDDARDRETGGTGLGLAIAHRAVVLHGGRITAANAENGGLEVRIFLPRVRFGNDETRRLDGPSKI
ncbi:MAG: ATP-binding protein [Thermovirgaceae bacterium]